MNTTTSRSTGDGDRRTRLLQRTLGNQTVQHLQEGGDLADALAIGPAADSDEREAERRARRLVGETPSAVARSARRAPSTGGSQRGEPIPEASALAGGRERAGESSSGGGRPLPASVRSFFAPRLDRELDDVRVYTGPHADATARSLDATAFTVGRHVVFRSSAYRPGTRQGTRLLAHELTHVAQQSTADRPRIQRQQADRPRESFEREQHDIVDFEFVDGRQQVRNAEGEKEGTRQTTGGKVDLHYDSGSGTFRCTFHLYWTFPPGWSDEQREQYRQRFAEVVGERWGEQHQLIEYAGSDEDAEPTGRTAKVVVDFEHVSMPAEYEQLSSLSARTAWLAESEHSEARQRKTRAFQVDVSPTDVTDSVRGREVNLDPGSLDAEESGVDRYRNYGRPEEITQHNMDRRLNPPYEHFEEAGVPLELPGEGTTYEQVAAAHEFGHMIGLADEYILDAEDLRNVPADEREEAIENRNAATGRIMNIGSRVTPDAYRPFARWLSSLTDSEWRVE